MSSVADKSVIVGIDGSDQAELAAVFAIDEARCRGVSLRLIYVIRTDLRGALTADQYRAALDEAKGALRSAQAAISTCEQPLPARASITQGSPAGVLLAEAADAEMICLGASGMGRWGRAMLGSTAATVAGQAECAVVITPLPHVGAHDAETSWVIVPASTSTEHGSPVIEDAVAEARLRGWPVLAVGARDVEMGASRDDAVDRIAAEWRRRFPDVNVHPVATDSSVRQFLHDNPDVGGLVVVDRSSAADIAAIVGSERHPGRALLIARPHANRRLSAVDSARC